MPIQASDIKTYLSGGAANSDVDASIGGVKSSVEFASAELHNLFDVVASAESSAGDLEYRCVYVENTHASITLQNAVLFVPSNTPSEDTDFAVGLGSSAIDATEQVIADENTAPAGVSFSAPSTSGAGLSIGDLAPGEHKAIWMRRTVNAGASAYSNDNASFTVQGDTVA